MPTICSSCKKKQNVKLFQKNGKVLKTCETCRMKKTAKKTYDDPVYDSIPTQSGYGVQKAAPKKVIVKKQQPILYDPISSGSDDSSSYTGSESEYSSGSESDSESETESETESEEGLPPSPASDISPSGLSDISCAPCNKSFRTPQNLRMHLNSKAHAMNSN